MVSDNGLRHYYSEDQTSPLNLTKFSAKLRGYYFEFFVGSGVFSKTRIDRGSELLIEDVMLKDSWHILDLGCGYGPVGIAIAKSFPTSRVLMTDINKRAVQLTEMNIKLNNIKNAEVKHSNIYQNIDEKFDTIVVNPPQTAGKAVCFEIIDKSKYFLKDNGILQLVARHNKGGKHLSERMKFVFGNVKDIAKSSGYRIYVSEKR